MLDVCGYPHAITGFELQDRIIKGYIKLRFLFLKSICKMQSSTLWHTILSTIWLFATSVLLKYMYSHFSIIQCLPKITRKYLLFKISKRCKRIYHFVSEFWLKKVIAPEEKAEPVKSVYKCGSFVAHD